MPIINALLCRTHAAEENLNSHTALTYRIQYCRVKSRLSTASTACRRDAQGGEDKDRTGLMGITD